MKIEFFRDPGPGTRDPGKCGGASRVLLFPVPGPRSPVPSLSVEASP